MNLIIEQNKKTTKTAKTPKLVNKACFEETCMTRVYDKKKGVFYGF